MDPIDSYKKRLAQLQLWRKEAKNPKFIAPCEKALALTERAAEAWAHLVYATEKEQEAYLAYSNARVASILERMRRIEKEAKNLATRIKNERDDNKLAVLFLNAKHVEFERTTVQTAYDSFLIEDTFRRQRVNAVQGMQDSLFASVFAPDQKDFSMDAAIKAIEFAIGVVPIAGTIYDGSKKVWDLSRRDKVKGRQTDEHLTYLDDYSIALARWCVACEALIQSLKNSQDTYGE